MKIVSLLVVLLALVSIGAQEFNESQAPTVPIEVVLQGRKMVTHYLAQRIEAVYVHYTGRSIVQPGWQDHYFSREDLRAMNYVHDGQFSELQDALYGTTFSGSVVKTPDGYYEVDLEIKSYTADGKISLQGTGYLPITEAPDGSLIDGDFNTYMGLPPSLFIKTPEPIYAAKWLGKWEQNGFHDEDLQLRYENDDESGFVLPLRLLGKGNIVIADRDGNISGWDLDTNQKLSGKRVLALLGKINSSDLRSVSHPSGVGEINTGGLRFYKSNGQLYGRFPLFDVVTDKALIGSLGTALDVPIWGSETGLSPTSISLTPIYLKSPNTGLVAGTEYKMPHGSGGFFISLPPGGYHVRVEYDDVLDWEADPNPKG
jgi:hypothetical protein